MQYFIPTYNQSILTCQLSSSLRVHNKLIQFYLNAYDSLPWLQAQLNGFRRAVASSGGNAGLAAAYACRKVGMPITIYIPGSTPSFVKEALENQVHVYSTVYRNLVS